MVRLGIDIGGSGIKGALVDVRTGQLTTERYRIPTPIERTPDTMAEVVKQIAENFQYKGLIGVGFPSIVKHGVCMSPGNLSPLWVGQNIEKLFESYTGQPCAVINDADAAACAIMDYGVGKGKKGFIITITVGTGLGSGAFLDGKLIPNFELGQIPYKKHKKIESWASSAARENEGLSYEEWAKRFNKFLHYVTLISPPDLIILGGGISKEWDEFSPFIKCSVPIVPAVLQNQAGIIGAAAAAYLREFPELIREGI